MGNTVELLGTYGGDITHAQSAWTSTARELTPEKVDRMGKLLNTLAKDGHHTPFEKSSLHFLVKTDIATHIQILKHRIGVSVNAESARYKELKEGSYLIPDDWVGIKIKGFAQAGIHTYDKIETWTDALYEYNELGNSLYSQALEELTPVLGRKRAKESARYFKPYSSQISSDVMFNFRSFYHFQKLRNEAHAQLEIREVAEKMLYLVKAIPLDPFKLTLEAFQL